MNIWDVHTFFELAKYLRIKRQILFKLIFEEKICTKYEEIKIEKRSGGQRIIHIPNTYLKLIQKRLTKGFNKIFNEKDISCQGFIKEKSIFTNAFYHINKRLIIHLDLKDFFDSFSFPRILGFLKKNKKLNFNNNVAVIVANLLTYKNTLPQGAPTSPIITNLICSKMDFDLHKVAKKYRFAYTRYADDLNFSTRHKYNIDELKDTFLKEIEEIILANHFTINNEKTKFYSKLKRQIVTGLVVNQKVNVSKKFYRNTRAQAFNYFFTEHTDISKGANIYGKFSFLFSNVKEFSKNCPRLKAYTNFLFYETLLNNDKPLIVTEGKTDIRYIIAAIKFFNSNYPNLIDNVSENKLKISFLNSDSKKAKILTLGSGGYSNIRILNEFTNNSYFGKFANNTTKKKLVVSKWPVIFLFDREYKGKNNPVLCALENAIKDGFKSNHKSFNEIFENDKKNSLELDSFKKLYVMTLPLIEGKTATEPYSIEDLYPHIFLDTLIEGKKFNKDIKKDTDTEIGKNTFSRHIIKNYKSFNIETMENFILLLDNISNVIKKCE